MKKFTLILLLFLSTTVVFAQNKYFTKTGIIIFESDAPLEEIKAENRRVVSIFDDSTGQIEFSLLIRSFEFKKALMQEHFNEEYMESDKYPKSEFKGKILNIDEVDFNKDGEYTVKVSGKLTMHGETNDVETNGVFIVKNGEISANAKFSVLVEDYKIKIPSLMAKNIAEEIDITITIPKYELLKK